VATHFEVPPLRTCSTSVRANFPDPPRWFCCSFTPRPNRMNGEVIKCRQKRSRYGRIGLHRRLKRLSGLGLALAASGRPDEDWQGPETMA
jgi:hypothetical protein